MVSTQDQVAGLKKDALYIVVLLELGPERFDDELLQEAAEAARRSLR